MQHIALVLAILILIGIAPKRYSEKPEEKLTSIMEMQNMQEKETVKPVEDDCSGNDFSIYLSIIDISSL